MENIKFVLDFFDKIAPKVILIEDKLDKESNEAFLCIRGFLSEGGNFEDYKKALRKNNWKGSIYALIWGSGSLSELSEILKINLDTEKSIYEIDFMNLIGNSSIEIIKYWQGIKLRTRTTSKNNFLELISSINEKNISILAHSLGVSFSYNGILSISSQAKRIRNCIFMGGAISRHNKDWELLLDNISGNLTNFYNKNDIILNYFYKIGSFTVESPCGIKPIEIISENILNLPVPLEVGNSHFNYIDFLDKVDIF